jgi:hypothetical protein
MVIIDDLINRYSLFCKGRFDDKIESFSAYVFCF